MASYADNCNVNSGSQTSISPAARTRGIGRFGTPRTVFSPAAYSPVKAAACNGDGETYCSSVLLKSVRPLLENLAKHMHASSSQGLADGQHKPIKAYIPDAPDVKRPGIGRFGGKPVAAVLAPVVVNAAPFSPSAVVAPVVVPEVAPVAPMASTTPQVPKASVTAETISEEASARAADPSEKARWSKLRQEVRAMDIAMTRAAYLRWDKLSKETSWAMEIEAAIEAALRPCFVRKHPDAVANLTPKTVPPASAAAATATVAAAPAPSAASAVAKTTAVRGAAAIVEKAMRTPCAAAAVATTAMNSPAWASPVRGTAAAAQVSRPAVSARCKVGVESALSKNGCSIKARPALTAAGETSSRHASGVTRREGGGCGEGAAGRAAGGRQVGVKAAGGRAVASGVCGREGVKQQAGRREGLVHERQARPGCSSSSSSSSRAHRRSS
ncbi:unnamed protein product [Closterium sp. NIES-53]